MHDRENALKEWLNLVCIKQNYQLIPLTGDASFRRYYRVQYTNFSQIIMDAPPDKEDLKPFIHVAHVLAENKILVPTIHAMNLDEGFLLLSDLGDVLLLNELKKEPAPLYYQEAINILFRMQQCSIHELKLPSFDSSFMLKEMNLCTQWFLSAYLKLDLQENEIQLLEGQMDWIATVVAKQPLVFIHRDYHSRNLMLIHSDSFSKDTTAFLGVIDFQDAMVGPLTYDLVSLLKDCYISWPREQVVRWVDYFYQNSSLAQQYYSPKDFIRAFDLCGLQRHLKVLGIFCRLYLRDGKAGYLADLPLTLKYVLECCETYPELHFLFNFLQTRVDLL